jgi:hypothetical protein
MSLWLRKTGEPTAYVITPEVLAALTSVIACVSEGLPQCETEDGMRDFSNAVGGRILSQMHVIRSVVTETGKRPFDAIYIRPS